MLLTTYNPQNKNYFNLFADSHAYNKSTWLPPIDVSEDETVFTLTVDVPGVDDENLHLSAEKNILTISGKRQSQLNSDKHNIRRVERSVGEFKRVFTLPEDVDIENIIANKKDGVLEIEIPKKAKEQAKKIDIKFS